MIRGIEHQGEPTVLPIRRDYGATCAKVWNAVRRDRKDCIFVEKKKEECPKFVQDPTLELCYQYLARLSHVSDTEIGIIDTPRNQAR